MKQTSEITERIAEFKEKIRIVDEKLNEELQKNHRKRNLRLMKFLKKEQEVWGMGLSQLEWFLTEQ